MVKTQEIIDIGENGYDWIKIQVRLLDTAENLPISFQISSLCTIVADWCMYNLAKNVYLLR